MPSRIGGLLLPVALVAITACSMGAPRAQRDGGATAAGQASPSVRVEAGALTTAPPAIVASPPAAVLADLVRADGTSFDLASLRGHPALVFFGYTHCPDVCPTTIGELFSVLEERPEARAVFVSIDPERDTLDFLRRWTTYFPAGFIALTGSPGAVRRAADGFDVRYARVETTSTAGYAMSHTADVFLLDAEGQLRSAYPFGTSAQTMVADLTRLVTG